MARSHPPRNPQGNKALPPANDDTDAIVAEFVEPASNLITQQTVLVLVKENREEDLPKILDAEVEYNRKRFEVIRDNKEKDPDAIDIRKTRAFRRNIYYILIVFAGVLLLVMPFINLVACGIFGTIGMIIICGAMLNARDRELDLAGMLQVIQAIIHRR